MRKALDNEKVLAAISSISNLPASVCGSLPAHRPRSSEAFAL